MSDIDVSDTPKRAAGTAAADLVEDGMRLGLGTGSTVAWFLEALADRRLDVAGIPTSQATADRCRELGIALLDPGEVDELDLAVDGADEFDLELTATKGGGGALLREKVVASMARRFVLIATPDKEVRQLGITYPLPIEVVPFAVGPVMRTLRAREVQVVQRLTGDGSPYLTDNNNAILDAHFPEGIEDPGVTDISLSTLPGVVTTGLFVEMAVMAVLGHADGRVEHRTPGPAGPASETN
jgi:ribose 5-phosphate isomerase A